MTRIILTDMLPGQNYAVLVRSNSGSSVSDWSRLFQFTTVKDSAAPVAPTGLAVSVAGTSFVATWTAPTLSSDGTIATDLAGYNVKVESTGTATTNIYKVTGTRFEFPFELNAALFGVARGSITISVAGYDDSGNVGVYTPTVTASNPAPAMPANFLATSQQDAINLRWDAVTDSDLLQYRVYAGTTSGFTPGPTNIVWSGSATSATIASQSYGTDTYYKVAAVDVFQTPSTYNTAGPIRPASAFGVDITPPAIVTGVTVTPGFDSTTQQSYIDISWTASSSGDVQTYVVRYSNASSSGWSYQQVNGDATATRITNLIPGASYYIGVQAVDFAANESAFANAGTYPAVAAKDTSAPSTPATPTVNSAVQRIQVTLSGNNSGGTAMETDVDYYEVHYSTVSAAFTTSNTTMIGQISNGPAMVATFNIPAGTAAAGATTQTIYVKVIAVDRAGNKSPASSAATATPGLINTVNIVDAAITNAKIGTVSVDKLIAGTGIANDFTIKSTLTLGDSTTDGAIQSFGYAAGTTGFKLAKSGLEINQGSIAAAALRIQTGQNLIPPAYADFEHNTTFYSSGGMTGSSLLYGVASANLPLKYGTQYLATVWGTASTNPTVYLARTVTDYNIIAEAGATHIVSAYVRTAGAVATVVRLNVKFSDGTTQLVTSVTPTVSSAAWSRISGSITIPAGVTGYLVYIDSTTFTSGGGFDVDGVQAEIKTGALTTPSPWTPPSSTTIDAGGIRTGQISSNNLINVNGVDMPTWSLNMQGNMLVGDALVRGRLIVGTVDDADAGLSYVQSGNYNADVSGWRIDSSGRAEFQDASVRGDIDAISGTFSGILTITDSGRITTGGALEPRIEMDNTGFRSYSDESSLLVNFPTDPLLPNTLRAQVVADAITVTDNLSLRGLNNEIAVGSKLTMYSTIGSSAVAPTVTTNWKQVGFDATFLSYRKGLMVQGSDYVFGASFYSAGLVSKNSATGAVGSYAGFNDSTAGGNVQGGFTQVGTTWYLLINRGLNGTSSSGWWVRSYSSAGTYLGQWQVQAGAQTYDWTIGTNGTELLLARCENSTGYLTIRRYTTSGSLVATYTSTHAIKQHLSSVMFGSFDFGSSRYLVSTSVAGVNSKVYTYTLSGTTLTNVSGETFSGAKNEKIAGLTWDGANFVSLSYDSPNFFKYSGNVWTTESTTWYASFAWKQSGGGYLTTQSKTAKFTMTKRSWLTLTAPPIPTTATPATDPDSVRFYIGRGTTTPLVSGMYAQPDPPTGNTSITLTSTVFTGTTPVTSPTFPGAASAQIVSSATRVNGAPKLIMSADGTLNTHVIYMGVPGDPVQSIIQWDMQNSTNLANYTMRQYMYQSSTSGLAIVVQKSGTEVSRMQFTENGDLLRTISNGPASYVQWREDTGIVTSTGITAASGFSISSSRYQVVNGIAYIYINLARTGAAIAAGNIANFTVATVPALLRPGTVWGTLNGGSAGPGLSGIINTDGTIDIGWLGTGLSTSDTFSVTGSWPL